MPPDYDSETEVDDISKEKDLTEIVERTTGTQSKAKNKCTIIIMSLSLRVFHKTLLVCKEVTWGSKYFTNLCLVTGSHAFLKSER